jgi:hypothetical protein
MTNIVNGDFETGDLTGWSTIIDPGNTVGASGDAAASGSYGCEIYTKTEAYIYQAVDFGDNTTLRVKYRIADGGPAQEPPYDVPMYIYVLFRDPDFYYTVLGSVYIEPGIVETEFTTIECDLTEVSGAVGTLFIGVTYYTEF